MNNNAVYPKAKLVSRSAKRTYFNEAKKVIEDFDKINGTFLSRIYDKYIHYDREVYDNLYREHLLWWEETYQWYVDNVKLKYTAIDPHWFQRNYQPLIN